MDHNDNRLPATLRALLADLQEPPASDSRMVRIARGERAYDAVSACLGDSDPILAGIAEILWSEYSELGLEENIEAQLQRMVAVLDRPDADFSLMLGMAFKHLAVLRMEQGRWDEVLAYCQRGVKVFAEADEDDHLEAARLQYMLGAVYVKRGELTDARDTLLSSLPVLRQHADARGQLIKALRLLGQAARDQDEPDDAYHHFVEAMGVLFQSLEITNEFFEISLGAGLCLMEMKQFVEAEKCIRTMLDAMEESPPTDLTLLPRTLDILGEAQMELGHYSEALATYERALPAGEIAYEPVSNELADLYVYLARAHDELANDQSAELALRKAIAIYEHLPVEPCPEPFYIDALFDLAQRCLDSERLDEADEFAQRLPRLLEPVVGPAAPSVGQALGLCGHIRYARGEYAEALALFEQAIEIFHGTDVPADDRLELMNTALEIREHHAPAGEQNDSVFEQMTSALKEAIREVEEERRAMPPESGLH